MFVSRLGRDVVVVLFSWFVCSCVVYLISFFLGDLGCLFVDLHSVSSRGVFSAGYDVPLLSVLCTRLSRSSAWAAVRFYVV